MNNEQIKEKLKKLCECELDFTVTLTGKESKKVNGFYMPSTHEIFLHNKNFSNDNMLFYTAVHEFTHHIINAKKIAAGEKEISGKAHNNEFWSLFDQLINEAEERGFYKRTRSEKLNSMINEAKKIDEEIAGLKKKLGKILCEIQKQSKEEEVRFEDVLSHDIRIKKTTAQKCQKAGLIDIDVGQDMQEVLIKTYRKSEEIKNEAVKAVQNGESVERVTSRISAPKNTDSPHDKLIKEKNRIEKTITVLNQRLEIVLEQLEAA